eukprot:UN2754
MTHLQFYQMNAYTEDMHGFIFETSILILTGSTRYLSDSQGP